MVEHIYQASDLLTYLRLAQQITVAALHQSTDHPAIALLEDYMAKGFTVEVCPEWSLKTIRNSIGKGP